MDTRDRLIEVAQTLFATRGVDAVGVQEVCDAASVTKPTLYHHLGSKEGLVQAVLDRGFSRLNRALDALGPYDRDLPWYLERQARLWIGSVHDQPNWFRLELALSFLSAENPAAAQVRPGLQALVARFEALFLEASAQHGNMRGRERLLAAGWHGALNHWTGLELGGAARADEDLIDQDLIRAGTRQFLYGIFS